MLYCFSAHIQLTGAHWVNLVWGSSPTFCADTVSAAPGAERNILFFGKSSWNSYQLSWPGFREMAQQVRALGLFRGMSSVPSSYVGLLTTPCNSSFGEFAGPPLWVLVGTRTHTAYSHPSMCAHTRTVTDTHTHIYTYTHARTHIDTHTGTHRDMQVCTNTEKFKTKQTRTWLAAPFSSHVFPASWWSQQPVPLPKPLLPSWDPDSSTDPSVS